MRSSTGRTYAFWPEYIVKMTVNADVGYGNAVFISGDKIGNWEHAIRLRCVSGNEWTITIDRLKLKDGAEFKFLIGPYEAGEHARVCELSLLEGEKLQYTQAEAYPGPIFTLDSATKRFTP